ncbi:helix-turn-helix domain-containing protein [Actinoplanes sp. M2I2]|uniref:winged helix-turn-helix transcriptional regulator n=1 Tax=Actinoplanes sp. M2I2 TaxID=1734444 RepID=UPI0020221688|nr:helix-turn-helix domain-containing protein [Actinoplanes sp. M2I2]
MRGYGQYCPIALAAEVYAERWTPIIIRNLDLGCERYTEILDGAPGLPRSVLSQRLRVLERTGVVERERAGRGTFYRLTESGRELARVGDVLGEWGARWRDVDPAGQDPRLALWTVARRVGPATLPRPRIVVEFRIGDRRPPDHFWLVLSATGNEVLAQPPGFAADGSVTADVATVVRWHAGQSDLAVAGPSWLGRLVASWGRLGSYAEPGRTGPAEPRSSTRAKR